MSLVLALVGTVSGWVSLGGLMLSQLLERMTAGSAPWFVREELTFLCGPGLFFGVVTLIPLSRWLGRGWIMSLAAVPVSMFAMYCGVMALLFVSPIMSNGPDWIPGGKDAAALDGALNEAYSTVEALLGSKE